MPDSNEPTLQEATELVSTWAGVDARKNAALEVLFLHRLGEYRAAHRLNRVADGSFHDYQEAACRTAPMQLPPELKAATFAMGLAGEAGEVVDLLKKHLGHGHPLDTGKLMKELGDVLWYIAALCDFYGLTMRDVAYLNIVKLRERYPEGFDPARSRARKEGA